MTIASIIADVVAHVAQNAIDQLAAAVGAVLIVVGLVIGGIAWATKPGH